MPRTTALLVVAAILMLTLPARAQVDKPTEVTIDSYSFAFTVEADSLVMYEIDGPGFDAIHNPAGGGKGTKPDYKLTVVGDWIAVFSPEQADAAKLEHEPEEGLVLYADDVGNNTRLNEIMKGAMAAAEREPAGEAVVTVENGPSIKVPYFTWSKTVGTRTNYALMYTVLHGDAFIAVKVVANRPLTKAQIGWFTTKLTLLPPAPELAEEEPPAEAVTPAPPAAQ
jgi:hypothetical protein